MYRIIQKAKLEIKINKFWCRPRKGIWVLPYLPPPGILLIFALNSHFWSKIPGAHSFGLTKIYLIIFFFLWVLSNFLY